MDETEVYRYSLSFAAGSREKDLWVNSYRANLACAEFIRKTIAEDFDGMRLNDDLSPDNSGRIRLRPCHVGVGEYSRGGKCGWAVFESQQGVGKDLPRSAGLSQFGVLRHFPSRNRKRVGG